LAKFELTHSLMHFNSIGITASWMVCYWLPLPIVF